MTAAATAPDDTAPDTRHIDAKDFDARNIDAVNTLPPLPAAAPLTDKLARSNTVLAAVLADLAPARVAVAYTGGKDSGVALYLWKEALSRAAAGPLQVSSALNAISIDTGVKFPQVMALRDRVCADWNVALTIARPRFGLPEADLSTYPVAQDKVSCCRDLKISPLCLALADTGTAALLTGIRRDEHPSRAGRQYAELRAATQDETGGCPEHWQVNPILDWTEMDIWALITGQGLPFCELYLEGYRSLGCMPCTKPAGADSDERAGRDPDKERQLEILKGLGYF
ncbi:MAG: phosphoadenosine phosphosulfate reductase family protein [Humidesulfovibrio sp.]|nr:phosphoadenosine phosphosulfate reductase family protein [Humidesulfovibrio sp.]